MTQTASAVEIPKYNYRDLVPTDYHISKNIISMMVSYVLSGNKSIRRSHLMNLSTLINTYNPDAYKNDQEVVEMINFIKRGLEARLVYNLTDPQLILYQINGSITDDDDVSNYRELPSSDIDWLNKMVSETLNMAHVYQETEYMMDICTRFQNSRPGSDKATIAKEFQQEVNAIQNSFRRNKNESAEDVLFSLQPEIFEPVMRDSYNELTNPSRKLSLGNQALNELFGGGLEETRVYTILGLPGERKSATLLDMALQIKRYNKHIKTKDPTKRPCVVVLTMENKITETIARLFGMSLNRNSKMTEYTIEDVMRLMREEGRLVITDDDPIDIIIKFKPAFSCDTSYMYTLCEDLEDMGLECICFVQDYIGRIRSTQRSADTRLEYGFIVDEMKIFAGNKQIPVLTASQLNRDAAKHIDESRKMNKSDLVRMLGRSNTSESILILNNTDGAFIITPEKAPDGSTWLGIQRVKKRFEASNQEYFYIPYCGDSLALQEDIGMTPVSRTTMRTDMDFNNMPMVSKFSPNPIKDIADFDNDEDFIPSGLVTFNDTTVNVYSDLESTAAAMNKFWAQNWVYIEQGHAKDENGFYCPFVQIPA